MSSRSATKEVSLTIHDNTNTSLAIQKQSQLYRYIKQISVLARKNLLKNFSILNVMLMVFIIPTINCTNQVTSCGEYKIIFKDEGGKELTLTDSDIDKFEYFQGCFREGSFKEGMSNELHWKSELTCNFDQFKRILDLAKETPTDESIIGLEDFEKIAAIIDVLLPTSGTECVIFRNFTKFGLIGEKKSKSEEKHAYWRIFTSHSLI